LLPYLFSLVKKSEKLGKETSFFCKNYILIQALLFR
jgi:hypothetical protein